MVTTIGPKKYRGGKKILRHKACRFGLDFRVTNSDAALSKQLTARVEALTGE